MNPTKPTTLALDQLAESVRRGVVLALEERKAAEINGGAMAAWPPSTMGMYPVEPDPTW